MCLSIIYLQVGHVFPHRLHLLDALLHDLAGAEHRCVVLHRLLHLQRGGGVVQLIFVVKIHDEMMTQEIYQETHLESELRRGDVAVGEPDAVEVGDGGLAGVRAEISHLRKMRGSSLSHDLR